MRPRWTRAPLLVAVLSSLLLVSCFGGHGGGGGGGNGGGGGGNGGGGGGGGSSQVPVLQIAVTHTGNFQQGQTNATYTVTVTNTGTAATSGNVQVNVTIPAGETLVSSSGSGWATSGSVATRGDALAASQSWPSITVTVSVATTATSPQVVTVSITGGGAQNANAQDSTTIINTVSFLFGRYAFLFSGFDVNGAVAVAGSINVDANGIVTGEEDFKDPTTLLTAASISGNCQNSPVAATGFCNLTAGGKTSRYDFVLRNNFVVARLAEDPADAPNGCGPAFAKSSCGSGVLISQQVPNQNALTTAGGFNGYFSIAFSGTDAAGGRMAVEGNIFTDLGANVTPGASGSQADINDNATLIQPTPSTANNVTGKMTGPVDANGRATMTMSICTAVSSGVCNTPPLQQTLTLALYILAPEVPTTNQSGRAFAIDITPTATSKQVLSGQFNWLGNLPLNLTIDSTNFPVNVFALWGVSPGSPASSSTQIGIFNGMTGQLSFDSNDAGKFNGGPPGLPQAGTISAPISVAPNGRAVLSVMVGATPSTYILYLDAVSDGNMLGATVGGANDTKVSFGFFTGQVPNSNFNNAKITGNYVVGTSTPVLATVPNGAAPITLTPSTTVADSGTFSVSAGAVTGNYSFDPTSGGHGNGQFRRKHLPEWYRRFLHHYTKVNGRDGCRSGRDQRRDWLYSILAQGRK